MYKKGHEAGEDRQVDMVNRESLSFNSMRSVIVTKLETGRSQNKLNIPCKINTGIDGN